LAYGCIDGRMYTNDAAKPSWSTVHQEEGEECLFATQPRNHQRAEKGEKERAGNLKRADHHAHFANATKDTRFHCPAATNHDSDASRARATGTRGRRAQGETTASNAPTRAHSTSPSITSSLTCFKTTFSCLSPPLETFLAQYYY